MRDGGCGLSSRFADTREEAVRYWNRRRELESRVSPVAAPDKLNTKDYLLAPSGEGPQADQWADKPHRLVYDLCNEIERLRSAPSAPEEATDALLRVRWAVAKMPSYNVSSVRPEVVEATDGQWVSISDVFALIDAQGAPRSSGEDQPSSAGVSSVELHRIESQFYRGIQRAFNAKSWASAAYALDQRFQAIAKLPPLADEPPLDRSRLQRLLIERAEVLEIIEKQSLRRNDWFAVGDAENAGKDASLLRDLAAQLPRLRASAVDQPSKLTSEELAEAGITREELDERIAAIGRGEGIPHVDAVARVRERIEQASPQPAPPPVRGWSSPIEEEGRVAQPAEPTGATMGATELGLNARIGMLERTIERMKALMGEILEAAHQRTKAGREVTRESGSAYGGYIITREGDLVDMRDDIERIIRRAAPDLVKSAWEKHYPRPVASHTAEPDPSAEAKPHG